MLSLDSRIHSEAGWFGAAARGEMIRVEDLSVAGVEGCCRTAPTTLHQTQAQTQALKSECAEAKDASSQSSDEAVDVNKFASANEQGMRQLPHNIILQTARGVTLAGCLVIMTKDYKACVVVLGSGKESDICLEGCGSMNGLAQLSKDKVLLKDYSQMGFPSELLQRIRVDGAHSDSSILPLGRKLNGSRRLFLWGMKESPGYRTKMEDSTAVVEGFVTTTTLAYATETVIPASLSKSLRYITGLRSDESSVAEPLLLSTLPFHFVGVFDGHGGTDVSTKLAEQLPGYIVQELLSKGGVNEEKTGQQLPQTMFQTRTNRHSAVEMGSSPQNCSWTPYTRPASCVKQGAWTDSNNCLESSESDNNMHVDMMDTSIGLEAEMHPVSEGADDSRQTCPALTLKEFEDRIIHAFTKFNNDLPHIEEKTVGSTAIVSLISDWHLVIANVGDSRAVLRRRGVAFRLSRDHKPDQEDEEERIRRSGGRVWDFNGRRVMGLLAMTRAFGDDCLRPFGICATPEV